MLWNIGDKNIRTNERNGSKINRKISVKNQAQKPVETQMKEVQHSSFTIKNLVFLSILLSVLIFYCVLDVIPNTAFFTNSTNKIQKALHYISVSVIIFVSCGCGALGRV